MPVTIATVNYRLQPGQNNRNGKYIGWKGISFLHLHLHRQPTRIDTVRTNKPQIQDQHTKLNIFLCTRNNRIPLSMATEILTFPGISQKKKKHDILNKWEKLFHEWDDLTL